jgi:hypothetical protein
MAPAEFLSRAGNSFNRELLCEHGLLISERDKVTMVPIDVWDIICQSLPADRISISADTAVCPDCAASAADALTASQARASAAQSAKIALPFLLGNRYGSQRPTLHALLEKEPDSISDTGDSRAYLAPRAAITTLRSWARRPDNYSTTMKPEISSLLCKHNGLRMDVTRLLREAVATDQMNMLPFVTCVLVFC